MDEYIHSSNNKNCIAEVAECEIMRNTLVFFVCCIHRIHTLLFFSDCALFFLYVGRLKHNSGWRKGREKNKMRGNEAEEKWDSRTAFHYLKKLHCSWYIARMEILIHFCSINFSPSLLYIIAVTSPLCDVHTWKIIILLQHCKYHAEFFHYYEDSESTFLPFTLAYDYHARR